MNSKNPTYEGLIRFLDFAEETVANNKSCCGQSVAEILVLEFKSHYPRITISRPGQFLDTVRRLAAPTKSSTIGQTKLTGSPLHSYLRRQWIPRIRGTYDILIPRIRGTYDIFIL